MKKTNQIFSFFTLLVAFLCIISCATNFSGSFNYTSKLPKVVLSVHSDEADLSATSSISVKAELKNANNATVQTITENLNVSEVVKTINTNNVEFEFDFKCHGKFLVEISLNSANGKTIHKERQQVIITSDEYNIGSLSQTVPVSFFSLLVADEDYNTFVDSSLVSYFCLERDHQYDHSALLPNMVEIPALDNTSLDYVNRAAKYISYLHELNSESYFHFFINDAELNLISTFALDNGMAFDKFDITMFSDGTMTYNVFFDYFGNNPDDSTEKYDNLAKVWEEAKIKIANNDESYKLDILNAEGLKDWHQSMLHFNAVLLNDPDVNLKWIVNRISTDTFGNSSVFNTYLLPLKDKKFFALNLYNMYSALTETEKQAVKNLLSLEVSEVEKAAAAGKKIMVFLGTKGITPKEVDYLTFMIKHFGSDYAYFYKGHPGDTVLADPNSEKQNTFESLGITAIDYSVPAEFYWFFLNNVNMDYVGYKSSTYNNITEETYNAKIIFDTDYLDNSMDYTADLLMFFYNTVNGKDYYIIHDTKNNKFATWTNGADAVNLKWYSSRSLAINKI